MSIIEGIILIAFFIVAMMFVILAICPFMYTDTTSQDDIEQIKKDILNRM
jgi:hypothetical protein